MVDLGILKSWEVLDASGVVVASGPAGEVTATMPDGAYTLNAFDSYGDGWNGGTFTAYNATADTI